MDFEISKCNWILKAPRISGLLPDIRESFYRKFIQLYKNKLLEKSKTLLSMVLKNFGGSRKIPVGSENVKSKLTRERLEILKNVIVVRSNENM